MSETTDTKYRAKSIDGRWMYPIDGYQGRRSDWADGIEFIPDGHSAGFLLADDSVLELTYTARSARVLTHFTRGDSPIAANFPERVAIADWPAFAGPFGMATDEDGDEDGFAVQQYFTAEYTEAAPSTEIFALTSEYKDLPFDLNDELAAIDADQGWEFKGNVGYAVFGTEFAHHMPGAVHGVQKALADALNALTRVKAYDHTVRTTGAIEGYITLPFDDKRTHDVKDGRRTRKVTTVKDQRFEFRISDTATGKTKAAAVKAAERIIEQHVELVKSFGWEACGHCDGTGAIARSE